MAVLAPAIIDVRPADGTPGIARWLRGIGVRQVRLASGLVMFSYIFSHFFNHALGNFSYDTMEAWLGFHVWWWRLPLVNFTLYAAAATHFSLGLWALYQRRHFRYTAIEITQLVFGLSIPLLIASHLGIMRLGGLLYGRDPPFYSGVLFAYWVNRPYMIGVQFLLLTVAWTHACIGLYFWLRLKPFFKWAAPFLLAIAVLLPPLAMTGTHRGGHEVTERALQPQWRNEHIKTIPLAQRAIIEDITLFCFPIFYVSAIVLACQLRPQSDVAVIPVLPANVGADFVRNRKRVHIGEERYVVSMFVDMRGSTRLAEARLPFDTVFLVNRFLEAASQAVVDGGGQPNQFVGDGLLALFGLHADPATACRQAIRAAAMVASNVEHMNRQFAGDLQEPIQFGIGIHGGEVIIGDIGFRDHMVFTALGDAVNVAARLQDMTKALNCTVVGSEDVCSNAGIAPDRLTRTEVSIRGRDQPMSVCAAADPAELAGLLGEKAAASGALRAPGLA